MGANQPQDRLHKIRILRTFREHEVLPLSGGKINGSREDGVDLVPPFTRAVSVHAFL